MNLLRAKGRKSGQSYRSPASLPSSPRLPSSEVLLSNGSRPPLPPDGSIPPPTPLLQPPQAGSMGIGGWTSSDGTILLKGTSPQVHGMELIFFLFYVNFFSLFDCYSRDKEVLFDVLVLFRYN